MASWYGLALTLAVVFAGGVIGGMARFGLSRLVENARAATFAANTVACAIAGFAATTPVAWQLALGAGLAGALSTWSTLARELGDLITTGQHQLALHYALRTAVIGIVAAWFGMRWGLRAFGG
ncbi:FluC/FEX family fluoride channel [Corynebacterium wankanglinii]|uniref:Fluoride-specific ion channel FluC n=1 Tax=Corynebacterium wankanglinii TaxID=2735136 RepID=A0A838CM82_9CORY|nr:CrcB family protein [Corynebacterium wankanglinii]MBA1836254.1 CrcB family protein [Corynebacterium wankanglinii]